MAMDDEKCSLSTLKHSSLIRMNFGREEISIFSPSLAPLRNFPHERAKVQLKNLLGGNFSSSTLYGWLMCEKNRAVADAEGVHVRMANEQHTSDVGENDCAGR